MDRDTDVAAVDRARTDLAAAEQEAVEAANALDQKLAGLGLAQDQQDALSEAVQRVRDVANRLVGVRTALGDVTAGTGTSSASTAAASVSQPAAPEEAGEGVVQPDGSVAPEQGTAPSVGTTEVVQ